MDPVYLPQSKKNAKRENAVIVYEDEASFRQTPTFHRTWAPLNSQPKIPTHGQRNTQKIFGAIALLSGDFQYMHLEGSFDYESYIAYLDNVLVPHFYKRNHRIYLIHDNASYHTKPEVEEWKIKNSKYVEVFNLPKYSPEFNAQERIWHHTRMKATHNRYYDTKEKLCEVLFSTFANIQKDPQEVMGYLRPFF